jgi:hypothetical protein
MSDRFLTISEAEQFTGKSRSTLRRFIDGIVKAEQSPDRHLLKPTPEEAIALREQNQPFAWKVSEALLRRQFLKSEETTAAAEKGSADLPASDSSRLVAVLEKSVAMLERELGEKNGQIAAMNDRLRESNILLKDLQQRVALPPGPSAGTQTVEQGPKPTAVTAETVGEGAKPKKRAFAWLFGE